MTRKIKRFRKRNRRQGKQVTYESLEEARKHKIACEDLDDLDDAIEISSQVRVERSDNNSSPSKKGKVPQLQTSNVDIPTDYQFDWKNCDKDGYVPVVPKKYIKKH